MRQPNSGTTLPLASHTWPIASQALATNTAYAPAHFAMSGALVGGGIVLANARGALPRTAGGASPTIEAFVDADNFVTLRISNNNANALVALGVDAVVDLMYFPLSP